MLRILALFNDQRICIARKPRKVFHTFTIKRYQTSNKDVVFQFRQRETDSQIKKRKREENVFTVKDIDVAETKNKKAKKVDVNKEELVKVKVKSKRGKKEKPLGVRKDEDRTQFLKSVFGGGGAI